MLTLSISRAQNSTEDQAVADSQIRSPPAPNISNRCQIADWGLPQTIVNWFRKRGVTTLFEWQAECLCRGRVLFGQNLVYSAPTSAGKTLVADFLVLKQVFESRKKALIIEPFIALAREKSTSLKSMLWSTKAKVGAFCGNYYTPGGLAAVSVAVCTIEKANNFINKLISEEKLSDLGIIVVDEIHYLGDPSRGYLLELLLTKVLYYNSLKESNCRIQIVGLSATIPNLKCVAKWLKAALYITEYRPVPLEEKIKIDKHIYDGAKYLKDPHTDPLDVIDQAKIPLTRDIDDICYICIDSIVNGQSTLVFCESRRECEILAATLAEQIKILGCKQDSEIEQERLLSTGLRKNISATKIIDRISKLKACPAGADDELTRPLKFGVAFHHAGLTSEEREIIEDGFKDGTIKALMATSTLSSGVNLPARKVVIKSPMFYAGRKKEMLEPMVYKQMVGRAGRKNIDTHGESILICNSETQAVALKLLSASLNHITSSLGHIMINYSEDGKYNYEAPSSGLKKALLEVIVNNTAKTRANIDLYLKSTFWLSSSKLDDQKSFMNLVTKTLAFLVKKKFIEELKANNFRSTRLGFAVLASGLSPDESLELLDDLIRAREGFCLVNDLHIIYQITPNDIVKSIEIKDWINFASIWSELDEISQYVGKRVGVEETVIAKISRGFLNSLNSDESRIYRRFLIALAINDLVNETPLFKICAKYKLSKVIVQQAQRGTAQFAGVLSIFCEQLGYENMSALVKPLASRISFSCQRDLLELVKLNMARPIARSLYDNGYKSIIAVAKGEALDLEFAIRQAKPFKKDASFHENDKKVLASPTMWVPELAKSMLVLDYAQHLVDTARSFIELEFNLDFTQPPTKRKEDDQIVGRKSFGHEENGINHDKRLKTIQDPTASRPLIEDYRKDDGSQSESENKKESLTIGTMPRAKDIPNFEVKYISAKDELEDFLLSWMRYDSISLNFKVESEHSNNPIGHEVLRRRRRRRRKSGNSRSSDLNCSSDESEDLDQDGPGINLKLDIDNQKHVVTRLYTCFGDDFVVYVINTVKALSYIQKRLRDNLLDTPGGKPIKLYTQNIVSTYKILHSGFDLSRHTLNKLFEWHSFEVSWWMVNDCPLRGINNSNSSLSKVAETKWIPQFRHFLYPNSSKSGLRSNKSLKDFQRLKDIVKSGKTAILQPLINEILDELDRRKQLDAYYKAEVPSRLAMAHMMIHGIGLSMKNLGQELRLYEDLMNQLTEITRRCYAKSNRSINLTNIKQVAQVLYEDLDLKHHLLDHNTNSNISKDPTNAEILNILMQFHPFPKVVQDFRKINKALDALQSVNTHARVDKKLNMTRVCGKVDFWQLTGRVAMWDPDMFLINRNFHITIPAHERRAEEIIECLPRKCLVPLKGWCFVSADYSQLELRLMAHFSEDENLLNILNQTAQVDFSHDVFKTMASKIYKKPIEEVTSDNRQHAKQICYGIIYGMGIKSLSIQLGVDTDTASEFREQFSSAFPKIDTFIEKVLQECAESGYVESILGRRRRIDNLNSSRSELKSRAERVAVNTRIQSSASDIIKLAMQEIHQSILNNYYETARMVLEMHDELIFEVHPSVVEDFATELKEKMEHLPSLGSLKVDLKVSLKTGQDWSDLKPFPSDNKN